MDDDVDMVRLVVPPLLPLEVDVPATAAFKSDADRLVVLRPLAAAAAAATAARDTADEPVAV